MLGGADNPNGELPSYITGADTVPCLHRSRASAGGLQGKVNRCGHPVPPSRLP
ncbi:hypothetical protein [Escherichia coli]